MRFVGGPLHGKQLDVKDGRHAPPMSTIEVEGATHVYLRRAWHRTDPKSVEEFMMHESLSKLTPKVLANKAWAVMEPGKPNPWWKYVEEPK